MEVILYQNNAEINRVDKTNFLVQQLSLEGQFTSSVEMLQPVIRIEYRSNLTPTFNYVYIPSLLRYYFIDSVTLVNNGIWDLNLKVDVLMSYKSKILQQSAYISRNEFEYNSYLNDSEMIAYSTRSYTKIELENTLFNVNSESNNNYIVTIMSTPSEQGSE